MIAAINGHCVGGGFEIALACDLRFARNGGGRLGLPEVNLGVLPGTGGTQRLSRLIGSSRALKLMVDGQTFGTDEAEKLGLIHGVLGDTEVREIKGRNRMVPALARDTFIDEVIEIANGYCSPKKASLAIGHIKRAVQTGAELPLEAGLTLERELQAKLFASDDAQEGLSAFVEKRTRSLGTMKTYLNLLETVLNDGVTRGDRTARAQKVFWCSNAFSARRRFSCCHHKKATIQEHGL